ncbi:2-phospho-L-lactate guanylyltransferase [Streptomyces millisiae]|uniref:Phosphoenolpyruvate guanylyltransferase n=1 Tax=Streptomyces millisiae TaxID=3075542 RepID=A0ABU2LZN3_9ACTN|nr:2-phospho-L-lactate guanylyltransferase [Streptomyces sp. DSM 44918]MDT0322617.1 2-phospho-L-lactate guanylyltransferase [Streptomyces sp. DSM 44918]
MDGLGWTLVVPLKPLHLAKSRLAPVAGETLRPSLALAFAEDTVAAALTCPLVRKVLVVTDDPLATERLAALGASTAADLPGRGLNAALGHGERIARAEDQGAAVAALNADLPSLRPRELARVLAAAGRRRRSFLADAAGVGTTLLAATPGMPLDPGFGGPSRARHSASGATELLLAEVESVRRDVDTGEDLRDALALGVGPRTAAAVRALTAPAGLRASAGSGR